MKTLDIAREARPAHVGAPLSKGSRARQYWLSAALAVVTTRAVFFGIAYAAAWFLSSSQGRLGEGFLELWDNWDARIFVLVAEHGYSGEGTDAHATAFFPAFPLAIRALAALGLDAVVAGLVIVTLATIVATAYLYRLVDEEVGGDAGRRAMLYLLLFPTAVFLVAPYSEPLFLAGAVPAFYYARRSRWLIVGPWAALAMSARFAGVFLLFGLAAEFVRQKRFSLENAANAVTGLVVGALPLLAYGIFLSQARGNALYFFTDQRLGWGREFVGPVRSFLNTWNTWEGANYPTNFIFAWRVEILAAFVGAAFVAWAVSKREWGYAAYMGSFLGALVVSNWYFSIPRMLLSFFPAMVFMAAFTKKSYVRHEYVLFSLIPLATLGVVVFTRGAWFY